MKKCGNDAVGGGKMTMNEIMKWRTCFNEMKIYYIYWNNRNNLYTADEMK